MFKGKKYSTYATKSKQLQKGKPTLNEQVVSQVSPPSPPVPSVEEGNAALQSCMDTDIMQFCSHTGNEPPKSEQSVSRPSPMSPPPSVEEGNAAL